MGKTSFWKSEDIHLLSVSMTSLADGVKALRTTVEALSAATEAMVRDMEISSSTVTVHQGIKLPGMKALCGGLAALADGADAIRTVAKTVSTSTKTIIAGIETLCININSIYNAMSATSKFLEGEVMDLLNLFAGVEDMSEAEMIRFIRKQCMYSDLDFELPLEMILHLRSISINLKQMHIGYKKIQKGMKVTSKYNKVLLKSSNALYERLKYVAPIVQILSEAEKVSSPDKQTVYDAFEVLSLFLKSMSGNLDLVNCCKDLMYSGFEIINEDMSIVNDVIQEEVEDIKFVFQSLEYFLSQPAGMLIALNSW